MASPKPYASVSEESSDVQVLDSSEPLVTASSSAPMPTARVQVLDSNEPLVLPCVSSVPDEPVAGPSGVAAGSSGSLPVTASSSEDEDDVVAPAMLRPTGSTSRRIHLFSDELRIVAKQTATNN
ncbi:hypothetical protein ACJJTC_019671 [Scirpophaga incertulas]